MKRALIIIGILATALVLISACTPKQPMPPAQPVPPIIDYEPQAAQPIDTTAAEDVTVVEQEVVEIDDVTTDLDLNDLENLDQELAELENLEI